MKTFMNICPVAAKLLHADGRTRRNTDMKKLMVAFGDGPKAPKSGHVRFSVMLLSVPMSFAL
jgi:hypothetical protein